MLYCPGQQPLKFDEVRQLCANLAQMVLCNSTNLIAAGPTRTAERKDCSNFLRREAEIACSTKEPKGPNMPFIVNPMPAFCPVWRSEDADVLEVSDRLYVHSGAARQLPACDPPAAAFRDHDDFP